MATHTSTVTYEADFDPAWFLSTYYENIDCKKWTNADFVKFILDGLFDYFHEGNLTGEKLLDVGSGPCIHTVISASSHVKEIHLSDYTTMNRKFLNEWLNGDRILQQQLIEYLLTKEGYNLSLEDRNNELRGKVSAILSLDVRRNCPLGQDKHYPTYDIITSSLCLEVAAESIEKYKHIVSNISQLLNLNGWLVLIGVLEETFYKVGEVNFRTLSIDSETLKEIWIQEGFQIVSFREMNAPEGTDYSYSDYKSVFIMLLRKQN